MTISTGPIDEILRYLRKNIKKGYTLDSLSQALINQGYSKFEINRALKKLDQILINEAPILKTKPRITREIVPENQEESFQVPQEKKEDSWLKKFLNY